MEGVVNDMRSAMLRLYAAVEVLRAEGDAVCGDVRLVTRQWDAVDVTEAARERTRQAREQDRAQDREQ